jgi:signal transduction histidine kinase
VEGIVGSFVDRLAALFPLSFDPSTGAPIDPSIVAAHALSDLLIGLSYVAISLSLLVLYLGVRRELPFQWVTLAFGTFIVACGGTHFMHVVLLWTPAYELAGAVQGITVGASVATAVAVPPLIPRVRALLAAARTSEERRERAHLYEVELARREAAEEALRLRDEFLSIAAHELKTPITTVRGVAQMLTRRRAAGRLSDREAETRLIRRIDQQSARLARLVENLLDLSRIDSDQLTIERGPTDLVPLVADVVAAYEEVGVPHQFRLRGAPEATVDADPVRIEQVLTNLIDNALKYAPEGGEVEVDLTVEGGHVRLAVRDHGLGVPPEHRAQLFERLYRGHQESHRSGLGLGLYVSRQIVDRHGGTIRAEFPADGGTRFVVELPAPTAAGGVGPSAATVGATALGA